MLVSTSQSETAVGHRCARNQLLAARRNDGRASRPPKARRYLWLRWRLGLNDTHLFLEMLDLLLEVQDAIALVADASPTVFHACFHLTLHSSCVAVNMVARLRTFVWIEEVAATNLSRVLST